MRSASELTGRLDAFQPPNGVVVVDGDDEPVAARLRFLEIADVARMQDVEAAVREHDALAARFRFGDERDELRQVDEPAAAAALRVQRALQLRAARGRGADLADDDAGAEIRERRRVGGIESPPRRRRASSAITVSPAPVTSKTSRACVGSVSGSASCSNRVIPCSPRVTSSSSRSSSSRSASPLRSKSASSLQRPTTASNSPRFGVSAYAPR